MAISPWPLRYSRGGSVASTSVSHSTADGLPEGADQVLALGQVHAGLAADGGVDLAQQRGGHVHHRDAPVVDRGGEPGGVGDHAAADGHHAVAPGEAPPGPVPAQVLDGAEVLAVLALAHGEHAVLDAGVDRRRGSTPG